MLKSNIEFHPPIEYCDKDFEDKITNYQITI